MKMSLVHLPAICLLVAGVFLPTAVRAESPLEVPLMSAEGSLRMARAVGPNYPALVGAFEFQFTSMCGPTSGSVVLNAIKSPHVPTCAQALRAVNQFSILERIGKGRDQVLGQRPSWCEGMVPVMSRGVQLGQLNQAMRTFGLESTMRTADPTARTDELRGALIRAVTTPGRYVIVNFDRASLEQPGRGHMSPLGAYDKQTDSVLMMDVNSNYNFYWIPVDALIGAMRTRDANQWRGFLEISPLGSNSSP